jgi:hypothetical protein
MSDTGQEQDLGPDVEVPRVVEGRPEPVELDAEDGDGEAQM